MDFLSSTKLEAGQAEIIINTMKSGATRFIVRGPDKAYFDWIMDNTERQNVIAHLLLENEQVVSRQWWDRFVFWRKPAPLLITAVEWE
jgi:hypothetical protein